MIFIRVPISLMYEPIVYNNTVYHTTLNFTVPRSTENANLCTECVRCVVTAYQTKLLKIFRQFDIICDL